MVSKTAVLSVRIVSDATKAKAGLDETEDRVGRLEKRMQVATGVALAYAAGITAIAVSAARSASDLEQSAGAVESIFGAHAEAVKGLAEEAAQNVGLAQSQYQQLAAVLGAQLKNMGTSEEDLAGKTGDLIELGADLAATFGGTTSDAVAALSSLLRGERDPIERYGVSIKQADINARLAAEGLTDLDSDAARAATTQATLAILLEQTASASGQFAREANTAAGAQQRANAAWEDAQAQLGQALLPLWGDAAAVLERVAGWVGDNTELVQVLVVSIGAAAAAYALWTAAQWALNVAMDSNPIGAIIAVVGLLAAAVALVVANWDTLVHATTDAWTWSVEQAVGVYNWAVGVWEGFQAWVQSIIDWAHDAMDSLGDWIADRWNGLWGWAGDVLGIGGTIDHEHAWAGDLYDDEFDRIVGPSGPWPAWPSGLAPRDINLPPATVYNVTVNGAIDPVGTGRTVRRVLKTNSQLEGRYPIGVTP